MSSRQLIESAMPQADEPGMDLRESLNFKWLSPDQLSDIRDKAYNIYSEWAVDKFLGNLDRRTNFKSLGIKPVICTTDRPAVRTAHELAKVYGENNVEVFPPVAIDANNKPFNGKIKNITSGLYIFMWARRCMPEANGEFSCALSTSDSLEKIQRKLSKAGTAEESVKLTENIDWEVVSGPLKHNIKSAQTLTDYLVKHGATDNLQFVSTSWYFLELLRALRTAYGVEHVAYTFVNVLCSDDVDESKIDGKGVVIICFKQIVDSSIAVITDDSPDKILRELVKASSKQESLTESLGYAAIPEIRFFQTTCCSSRAGDIITKLEKYGVRGFPLVVNTEAGVTDIYADAVSAYGRSDVVMVWGDATTGNDFYRKAKKTKNVVIVKSSVTSWNVVMIATEDPVDKVVRKLTMARSMTEALPPPKEIDYPLIDAGGTAYKALAELQSLRCDVKYGITGTITSTFAESARKVYGNANVEMIVNSVYPLGCVYDEFYANVTGRQVWMMFASYRSANCVLIATDDGFDKILRKVTGANSVEESKSRAILKKLTTKASDVDPEQLKIGQKVEREHTSNPKVATQIALAHLGEKPDYYNKLDKAGLIDESAIDVELISNRMAEVQIHLRANQYVKAVFRNLRDFNKSLKFAVARRLLSSQITVARTVYGSHNVAFAYYDETPTVDELRQMEGNEVAVLIARGSVVVPAMGRILFIATPDSFEKIARKLAAYASTEEAMQLVPDQAALTENSNHFGYEDVNAIDTIKIGLRQIARSARRVELVPTDLPAMMLEARVHSAGYAMTSRIGWSGVSDLFIADCRGKNVVCFMKDLHARHKSISALAICTEDSPDKIMRRVARSAIDQVDESTGLSESSAVKLSAVSCVIPTKFYEPISNTISSLEDAGAELLICTVDMTSDAYGLQKLLVLSGYSSDVIGKASYIHQPDDTFIVNCANSRVVAMYYGPTSSSPLSLVFLRTDDSLEKIERRMNHAVSTHESASDRDSNKLLEMDSPSSDVTFTPEVMVELRRLKAAAARVEFSTTDEVPRIFRDQLKAAGYTGVSWGGMAGLADRFITACAGKRVVCFYRGRVYDRYGPYTHAAMTAVITDDSDDKIKRKVLASSISKQDVDESTLVPDPSECA